MQFAVGFAGTQSFLIGLDNPYLTQNKKLNENFKIQNSLSLYFSQRASINVVRSRTYLVYAIN